MKGLFECLRNKVYKEEEDILAQMAANAAMDDSEIEAFEADDEDEEDELDMFDVDIDAIDDADIERATNEFNMDEGDRAACRLKTIDLKEDSVELQPETKLNKKVSQDPDMRNFVGAGDGSGHDMDNKGDGVKLQPETALNRRVSQDPDMREFVGAGDGSGKDMKTEAFDAMMEEVMDEINALDEACKDKKSGAELVQTKAWKKANKARQMCDKFKIKEKINARRQAKAKEVAREEGCTLDEAMLFVLEAEQEFINEGYELEEIYGEACCGKCAGNAKDKLKAKRQAKAKEVAREEGCTLDEAMLFVLECEQEFINEGYELDEIYGEDSVELQPETKLNKKVSQDPDMRDFVGAGDGSGHDMDNESAIDDAIAKLAKKGNNNGVFPDEVELQDDALKEGDCCGECDPDECAPKRQQQKPVGDVDSVSVDGVDTDDELMLGIEAVIRDLEESIDDFDI